MEKSRVVVGDLARISLCEIHIMQGNSYEVITEESIRKYRNRVIEELKVSTGHCNFGVALSGKEDIPRNRVTVSDILGICGKELCQIYDGDRYSIETSTGNHLRYSLQGRVLDREVRSIEIFRGCVKINLKIY